MINTSRDPLEKIYNEVAQKYGLTYTMVKEIHRTQFAFFRHVMETSYDAIRFLHIGTFFIKKHRKEKLDERYQKALKAGTLHRQYDFSKIPEEKWDKIKPLKKDDKRIINIIEPE